MKPQAFDIIAGCLRAGSGLVIGPDKLYLLEARLGRIIKQQGLRDLDALAERLAVDRGGALTREVIEAMTTNESFFFRDDKPFVHFRTHVLPRLLASRPVGAKIRIWSAASSSGGRGAVGRENREMKNRRTQLRGEARRPLRGRHGGRARVVSGGAWATMLPSDARELSVN